MIKTQSIIVQRQVISTTYASFPTTGLTLGDLAYATDRQVLYRWNGSSWDSISISSRHGNYAAIGDPANYPESSLYQADDQGILYMIVSAAWIAIVSPPLTLVSAATDDLKNSNDLLKDSDSTVYTKTKETKVNEVYSGTMRLKFDLAAEYGGSAVWARLYKNGGAIGTERTSSITGFTTFSEDFTFSLAVNDLLQIYSKHTDGLHPAQVKNFRLCYNKKISAIGSESLVTEIIVARAALSTTNQDP